MALKSQRMTFVFAIGAAVFTFLTRLLPVPGLANIKPVGALSLFGGGRLHWWLAYPLPLIVMYLSDRVLHEINEEIRPFYWAYFSFAIYVLIGQVMCRKRSVVRITGAIFLGALQFYLITNFAVWYSHTAEPRADYPPTLAGLLACYIAGLPFFVRGFEVGRNALN